MEISPIEDGFGTIITGADLTGPGLEDTVRQIERALDDHLLVVLRGDELALSDYISLGAMFGDLEDFSFAGFAGNSVPISNADDRDVVLAPDDPVRLNFAADGYWHTDHTYRARRARYSFLRAEVLPDQGGETQFADTRAAYAALPQETKDRIDSLVALHSVIYSRTLSGYTGWTEEQRANLPPIPQPLVFTNPRTGAKSLYIASHIAEIIGMPTEEARALARELIDFATQPQFVYTHAWQVHDIAIWDDRATMHRRAPYDDINELRKLRALRVIEDSDLYDGLTIYTFN